MLKSEIKALTNALNAANEGARVRTLDLADVEAVIEEAARNGAAQTQRKAQAQTVVTAVMAGSTIKVRIERVKRGSDPQCTLSALRGFSDLSRAEWVKVTV